MASTRIDEGRDWFSGSVAAVGALLGFAVVFVAFLMAPLLVLAVALVVYAVVRASGSRRRAARPPADPGATGPAETTGLRSFGAGARR